MGTGVGSLQCAGPLPTQSIVVRELPETPSSNTSESSVHSDSQLSPGTSQKDNVPDMATRSCAGCTIQLTFFKRKICCHDCRDFFCTKCVASVSAPGITKGRRCFKCRTFAQPNRTDLMTVMLKYSLNMAFLCSLIW
jgi:hypothetical protein